MIAATGPTPSVENPFTQSSNLIGGAGDIYKDLGTGGFLENINKYVNPYYDSVLDSTLGRMETNKNLGMQQIGDAATAANAFGGSRHGVVEGTFLGEHDKNVGDVTNQIKSQGYDSAMQTMMQSMLTGAQGMTGVGGNLFDIGRTINQDQNMVGGQQENFLDQLLSGQQGAFNNMLNDPYKTMDLLQAILSGDARRGAGSTQSSSTPGLFDYLSLVTQAIGGL